MSSYLFDDNSIESKVLQFELIGQDVQVIKVQKESLDKWIGLISDVGITKIYLHFCYEDYVLSTRDIRADIATALHKNPNLRIICQYENTDRKSIERRASNYNITVPTYQFKDNEMKKGEDVEVDKFKAIKHTEIASDTISPVEMGGHVDLSEDFVKKLEEVHKDKIKLIEYNKEKATIDYSKYSVGGETKEVPAHIGQDLEADKLKAKQDPDDEMKQLDDKDNYIHKSDNQNLFTNKINEFKDKRRRKKKQE